MIFVGYTRCQIFFILTPKLGEMMIQFDGPHIFQMGWWFNHQLDYLLSMHGIFTYIYHMVGIFTYMNGWFF